MSIRHYLVPLLASLFLAACSGMPAMPALDMPNTGVITASGPDDPRTAQNRRAPEWLQTDEQKSRAADTVTALLQQPLNAESAVDIALLNNPLLQSRMAELGIAIADLEQARRLPNPTFSFLRTRADDGLDIERGLHFNLVRLVFYPQLRGIEAKRLEQTRLLTLHEAFALANRTRRAFYEAVAARQKLAYAVQVADTADAAAELARRLEKAGNYNPLSRAREQAFAIDAQQSLTRARQQESATRIRLLRLLGLTPGTPGLTLPDTLAPLPAELRNAADIRRMGINQRLDVQAAQQDALRTADLLGLSKASRFVSVAELGGLRESTADGGVKRSVELSLSLPVFDSGDARIAKAQATYDRALNRVKATALEADGDIQLALDAWQTHFELARRQRDETIPLRKRITDETLLRYNGMIGSVFELLAESRAQVTSVSSYIDLLRDFWIADADLGMALLGKPALGAANVASQTSATPDGAAAASSSAPHGGGH